MFAVARFIMHHVTSGRSDNRWRIRGMRNIDIVLISEQRHGVVSRQPVGKSVFAKSDRWANEIPVR